MSTNKNPVKNFEQSMAKLEQIVNDLEQNNLSLEQSLTQFEAGIKLTRECQEALTQAEQKIEYLTKNNDNLRTSDLEDE